MRRLSMSTRDELVAAVGVRYRGASREEKGRILEEFVAVSGYCRKHAARLLHRDGRPGRSEPRLSRRTYDDAVREALVVLWESSDRICGKRLKALIPMLVGSMEQHGHLALDEEVRARLMKISAATIDRVLAPMRAQSSGRARRRTAPSLAIRRSVPVRTFSDWGDPPPGFVEADLVAHSGPITRGSFIQTLVLTDVASGWTECAPLLFREQTLPREVLNVVSSAMPFPLAGFDTDNDSVFMNETVLEWCAKAGAEFTRCRPYRKNDQAWVEQKNGAVVRRLVGYRRYEGVAAATLLAELYALARLFVNIFQPSFKLAVKERNGARVMKRYHPPATPCRRLMAHPSTSEGMKERLSALEMSLDPVELLARMRGLQARLAGLADGITPEVGKEAASLEAFLAGLRVAWEGGEARPTAMARAKPPRTWRSRVDPFAAVADDLDRRFSASPASTAREIFEILQAERPGIYADNLLRTFQRRIKVWRHEHAKALVFGATVDRRLRHEATEQSASGKGTS